MLMQCSYCGDVYDIDDMYVANETFALCDVCQFDVREELDD